MKPACRPIPDRAAIDQAGFAAEIVPAAMPVVLRGQVAAWPLVTATCRSVAGFAAALRAIATPATGEVWVAPPEAAGRFGFSGDLEATNFERKLASIDQLLDLLERQQGDAQPWGLYAGALPVARHLQHFAASHPMALLDSSRPMLVSLWLGNRTKTAAH